MKCAEDITEKAQKLVSAFFEQCTEDSAETEQTDADSRRSILETKL